MVPIYAWGGVFLFVGGLLERRLGLKLPLLLGGLLERRLGGLLERRERRSSLPFDLERERERDE